MASASMNSIEGRLYRGALCLFPAAFRREHGAEMARDFDDARHEAVGSRRALWALRGCIAIDLVRTLAVQWLRSTLPLIAIASIFLSLAIFEGIAAVARRVVVPIPDGVAQDDMVVILFMVEISVVLIAATVLISQWVGRMTRPRRK
jgi:hypothetical protein